MKSYLNLNLLGILIYPPGRVACFSSVFVFYFLFPIFFFLTWSFILGFSSCIFVNYSFSLDFQILSFHFPASFHFNFFSVFFFGPFGATASLARFDSGSGLHRWPHVRATFPRRARQNSTDVPRSLLASLPARCGGR